MECNRCKHELKVYGPDAVCYYFIEGENYCTPCGIILNDARKQKLEREMYQELFFGDEQ